MRKVCGENQLPDLYCEMVQLGKKRLTQQLTEKQSCSQSSDPNSKSASLYPSFTSFFKFKYTNTIISFNPKIIM